MRFTDAVVSRSVIVEQDSEISENLADAHHEGSCSLDPLVILATFVVIFPAELPDKSMFAGVVMGARFRPMAVWIGLAAAFFTHVVIAVTAGHAVSYLPSTPTGIVVTIFFVLGGMYLLLGKQDDAEQVDPESDVDGVTPGGQSFFRTAAMAYGVVFVSEWGDLTQLATINLTARYEDPFSVAVGAVTALWAVSALGVWLGGRLVRLVPLRLVRRAAGTVLLGLAIWSLIDLL